ncbi:MAG: ABC transporter ATP-binding protein [Planctomycetes bacterium]|nr:ABC transporter ATP-binding protein [Planctomycetota bacterium]
MEEEDQRVQGVNPNGDILLQVRSLRTHFFTDAGVVKAVDGLSFSLERGKTLGLVGESGCGKSVTALSILRLVDEPGRIAGGEILFEGKDLLRLTEAEMRHIRGNRIAMIFQEPMTSLNPVFTIGNQIMEVIALHQKAGRKEARERALELLRRVKMPAPEQRLGEYPHQLSGGMRQRAMIAMALACSPRLLIADEPTTALDVTIQAQILDLLRELQEELGMAVLLITHDLGVVAEVADRVLVMYASKAAEVASKAELFREPLHPYTRGLFEARPARRAAKGEKLRVIPGAVPNPLHFPAGCKFHPRCPIAVPRCQEVEPEPRELRPGHWVACDVAGGSA